MLVGFRASIVELVLLFQALILNRLFQNIMGVWNSFSCSIETYCRLYFLFAPWVAGATSFASVFPPFKSSFARSSLGVFLEEEWSAVSEATPLEFAIFRWSFLRCPSFTPSASKSDSVMSRIVSQLSNPCSRKSWRYCWIPSSSNIISTSVIQHFVIEYLRPGFSSFVVTILWEPSNLLFSFLESERFSKTEILCYSARPLIICRYRLMLGLQNNWKYVHRYTQAKISPFGIWRWTSSGVVEITAAHARFSPGKRRFFSFEFVEEMATNIYGKLYWN